MGSLRVGDNWATSLSLFTFMHWRRQWQPTPVFLPGESQGRGSLVGCRLWVTHSRTRLKRLSSTSSSSGSSFSDTALFIYWEKLFYLIGHKLTNCNGFVSQEIFKSKFPKTHKKCTQNLKLYLNCIKNVLCHIFIVLFLNHPFSVQQVQYLLQEFCLVSPYFHFLMLV